jgi:hypothetical protein
MTAAPAACKRKIGKFAGHTGNMVCKREITRGIISSDRRRESTEPNWRCAYDVVFNAGGGVRWTAINGAGHTDNGRGRCHRHSISRPAFNDAFNAGGRQ